MKYKEIEEKFEGAARFGSLPGVKISEKMLAAVGNPQKGLPFIHIAGTNGKGSTAAFLRSVLTEAGYKTGMYTSPHLEEFTERFSVDGKNISKEDFKGIGEWILGQNFGVSPTMSDYCLLLSLLFFKERRCDVAIFETGLGGRLDSTNALGVPEVAVLTYGDTGEYLIRNRHGKGRNTKTWLQGRFRAPVPGGGGSVSEILQRTAHSPYPCGKPGYRGGRGTIFLSRGRGI